jgi:hypothetical protein
MEVEIKFDGEVIARIDVVGQDNPTTACDAVRKHLNIAAMRPPKYKLDLTPNKRALDEPVRDPLGPGQP